MEYLLDHIDKVIRSKYTPFIPSSNYQVNCSQHGSIISANILHHLSESLPSHLAAVRAAHDAYFGGLTINHINVTELFTLRSNVLDFLFELSVLFFPLCCFSH